MAKIRDTPHKGVENPNFHAVSLPFVANARHVRACNANTHLNAPSAGELAYPFNANL